jgi:6-pyruvoyltetrahydropterin/6-carboxytetrahydropterin synthase
MTHVRVTRRVHFSAAHRLHRDEWSESKNAEIFGDCSNPNWHGHNYEMDVTVSGPVSADTGFVMDLKDLRDVVETLVVRDVDHRNLNLDVPWMEGIIPSTENFVVAIWNRLCDRMPEGVKLERLVLWETPRNSVEYAGE